MSMLEYQAEEVKSRIDFFADREELANSVENRVATFEQFLELGQSRTTKPRPHTQPLTHLSGQQSKLTENATYFSSLLQERFGMDLHVSDLGHDLFPAGHRADEGSPATALLLPGLDVLGAPPGMTLHCQ